MKAGQSLQAPDLRQIRDRGPDWETPGVRLSGGGAIAPGLDDAILPGLLNFAGVAGFFRRKALLIAMMVLLGAFAAIVINVVSPARYTATALLEIKTQSARATPYEDVAPGIGNDAAAIASIIEITNADATLQALVEQNDLMHDPELAARGLTGGEPVLADVISALSKVLKVQRRGLTYIIEVSVTLKNAENASKLTNKVAEFIAEHQRSTRSGTSAEVVKNIEAKLASLNEASVASSTAAAFRKAHGLGETRADGTIGDRRLNYLAQQIALTRDKLEAAKAHYEEIKRIRPLEQDMTADASSGLLTGLRAQYAAAQRQIAELALVYGPQHPQLKQVRESAQVMGRQIVAEQGRLISSARSDVDALQKQVGSMERELGLQNNQEIATAEDRATLARLDSQAALDKDVFDQFAKKQKVAQQQADLAQPDVILASPARVPSRPNKPSMALIAPVGAFIGLMGGILLGLRAPSKPNFRQVEFAAAPPVRQAQQRNEHQETSQQELSKNDAQVEAGQRAAVQMAAHAAQVMPKPAKSRPEFIAPQPLSQAAPKPPLAVDSAVRDALARAYQQLPSFGRAQVVAVAALEGEAGLVAQALARLAVADHAAVLLVRAHLHGKGLFDVVLDQADPLKYVRVEAKFGFMTMASGCASPEDFWEMLTHQDFGMALALLEKAWDIILIEMPDMMDVRLPALPAGQVSALVVAVDAGAWHGATKAKMQRWENLLQAQALVVPPFLADAPQSALRRA